MTGWEVPGPMLVTATPGTDSTVCARVAASRRCRFSPAKTAEGRIVSFAAVGFTTAVTTTSGKGMAATSRSTVTISPGRASTATAAYPSRSIRSRRRSASGTAMRNDPSPCVTALPPVLTTVAIAPARASRRLRTERFPLRGRGCLRPAARQVKSPPRVPERLRGSSRGGKRGRKSVWISLWQCRTATWLSPVGCTVSGAPWTSLRPTRGSAWGDFSLQRDGDGGSAAPVGREVERCGGRPVSRDCGSMRRVRAGENRRIRPGGVAGRLRQLAHGTLRSWLGLVLMRVESLRDGGDEEREDDGDSGERVRAPPAPRRIKLVGHRLSRAASWTHGRPGCGTDRYADRHCVPGSCVCWNSGLPAPAPLFTVDGVTPATSETGRECVGRNDNGLSL